MGSGCSTHRVQPVIVSISHGPEESTISLKKVRVEPQSSSSVAEEAVEETAPAEPEPADEPDHPATAEVSLAAREGIAAVLKLMRAHENDAVYAGWCCDAIAGLCAGNGELPLIPHPRCILWARRICVVS